MPRMKPAAPLELEKSNQVSRKRYTPKGKLRSLARLVNAAQEPATLNHKESLGRLEEKMRTAILDGDAGFFRNLHKVMSDPKFSEAKCTAENRAIDAWVWYAHGDAEPGYFREPKQPTWAEIRDRVNQDWPNKEGISETEWRRIEKALVDLMD